MQRAARRVAWMRSKGEGSPPCCRWPRIAWRTSNRSLPFFFKQGAHEGGVVDRVGVFVADHQPEAFAVLESRSSDCPRRFCRSCRVTPSSCR